MDPDLRLDIARAAAKRWVTRQEMRDADRGRPVTEVEKPERIAARLERLTNAAAASSAPIVADAVLPEPEVLRSLGFERTIGARDYQAIASLELALAVSRYVGRIRIRTAPTRADGFGTGFMVSPRLLLTNNHVLPDATVAGFSEVEFDVQNDRFGNALPTVGFKLRPDLFFMTDGALDFTLVAVDEASGGAIRLQSFGWSRLIGTQGKILKGEHMNIIQHPRGGLKQVVARDNELVDLFDDFAHYVTDTEPGSSGSPVYNDQWEVVALHHSGVPRTKDGKILDLAGKPWDGANPDAIDWVANEGIRISSLVAHIEKQPLEDGAARLRDDLLSLEPPNPLEAARVDERRKRPPRQPSPGDDPIAPVAGPAGRLTLTIPLRITIEIGAPEPSGPSEPQATIDHALSADTEGEGLTLDEAMGQVAAMASGFDAGAFREATEALGSYAGLPARVELLADGRRLRLLAPLSYTDPGGGAWPVPAGTVVDGASIPRVFWTVIGGPLEGRYRDASIVHDRFCDTHARSWEDTHRMFYWAMRRSAVAPVQAQVMFYAVWRFGPRWTLGAEATGPAGAAGREPTDADAATILADVRRIRDGSLDLDAIERLAEGGEAKAPEERGPATPKPARRRRTPGA